MKRIILSMPALCAAGVMRARDIHQGGTQGFLVDFCNETSIGINTHAAATSALTAVETGGGILVQGLPPGQHELTLQDALGRVVAQRIVRRSTGEGVLFNGAVKVASGMYILRADGKDCVKVWLGAR